MADERTQNTPASTPPSEGTLTETADEARRRKLRSIGWAVTKWIAFGVFFASLPVVLNGSLLWFEQGSMNKRSLLSNGELLIVSAGIAAAGIGDLVFDRRAAGGENIRGFRGLSIAICIALAVLGSSFYALNSLRNQENAVTDRKVTQTPEQQRDEERRQDRVANVSLTFFVASIAAGGGCVVLSEI
jgi:hypothetical protein